MKTVFNLNEDLILRLKNGSAILMPTDTLPALAALPEFSAQLWEIKNRPKQKPLILMGASSNELFSNILPDALNDASEMAKAFWPGALTMVLPASGDFAMALNPGSKTLGLRVPGCAMARNFLKLTGPLATTSANISGETPPVMELEVSKIFPDIPLLHPLPWPTPSGIASTVISWSGPSNWHLLRRGAVIPVNLLKE